VRQQFELGPGELKRHGDKASGWAKVYGSSTGGDGIAIDPAVLTLPNSGMVVRFPSVMGLNPDWSANEERHTDADAGISVSPSGFRKYVEWQRGDAAKAPNLECDIPLKVTVMDALGPH
jgi:hypothetical protein